MLKWVILSGSFAQLLRYTIPADARSTIVRLRSVRNCKPCIWNKIPHSKWTRSEKMKDNEIGEIKGNSAVKVSVVRTESILEVKALK